MTVYVLFDDFGTDSPQLVGVVDSRIAAMSFVGFQFNAIDDRKPPEEQPKLTRYFEEMDVTDRFIAQY